MVHEDLDTLLYAWLSEPDKGRAEQRFTQYFRRAFPDICRFLRSLRADAATAEDVSQQALIKLFAHLGTERRAADVRLREALSSLAPLPFGEIHVRLVHGWRDHVRAFRDAALCFRIPPDLQRASGAWKELRDEINGQAEPLQRQGTHLLHDVRERVASALHALIARDSPNPGIAQTVGPAAHAQMEDAPHEAPLGAAHAQIGSFVAALLQYAAGRDGSQVDTALGCAGVVGFVTRTSTICTSLPVLAIPSNGLLYTIAKRQFLDSLRRKRADRVELTAAVSKEASRSLLEEWDLEESPCDHASERAAWAGRALSEPTDQSDREQGIEQRYQAFLDFLRAPLTRAEGRLAGAAGKAKAEQARVDSCRRKYERLMAVLAALHESPQPSEEEIARRQGITRNQVKYVIERAREEFNHFFPDLASDTPGRRKRQGAET